MFDFSTVRGLVQSCIEGVKNLKNTPGPALQSIDTIIVTLQEQDITVFVVTDFNKQKFKVVVYGKFVTYFVNTCSVRSFSLQAHQERAKATSNSIYCSITA